MKPTLEIILRKLLELAEKVIGASTTAATEPLEKVLLLEREELDLSGGCGKIRFAAQYRGKALLMRLALSPEAAATACLELAKHWARAGYPLLQECDPSIAEDARFVVVMIAQEGAHPQLLYRVSKTGAENLTG